MRRKLELPQIEGATKIACALKRIEVRESIQDLYAVVGMGLVVFLQRLKLHLHCVFEAELKLGPHVERPMVVSASDFESQKVTVAKPCCTLLAARP